MQGGELFVPRIPSMRILDLVEAVAPDAPTHEIGIRPGEKLHEEMIAADDSRRTLRFPDRYVVQPVVASWGYEPPEGGERGAGRLQLPLGQQRPVARRIDEMRDLLGA